MLVLQIKIRARRRIIIKRATRRNVEVRKGYACVDAHAMGDCHKEKNNFFKSMPMDVCKTDN